ncbi:MAG: ubiquitin-like small modifier protein 1 [Halodesulfurarchaeum sp.]
MTDMDVSWKLFATLREAAGEAEVVVSVVPGGTVADAFDALLDRYPALEAEAFDGGDLRPHISVVHNGVRVEDPLETEREVSRDDELALVPPMSGG